MTAEKLLQESIIVLQKHDLNAETRRLADEAAQLLADGRDIEARALVEKAQALNAPGLQPKANGVSKGNSPISEGVQETLISRITNRLTLGIANAVAEAIEELHRSLCTQMRDATQSLEDRLGEIASQWMPLFQQRVEKLEQERNIAASEAQERWARVSECIGALQEADAAHRLEAEQRNRTLSGELEQISARVTEHDERVEALKHLVGDLSSKVTCAAQQIDRHTDLLRSMQERQAQRAAALNSVLDGIAKLREPRSHPEETEAA
jgi:hypothetical protein